MKYLLTILAVFVFSFGFSQNYTESFAASSSSDFEAFDDYVKTTPETDQFNFTVNEDLGDVVFNAPEKINVINIYNSDNQEIFSAQGSIIEDSKINLSYLPAGTYYLEVLTKEGMGAQMLTLK